MRKLCFAVWLAAAGLPAAGVEPGFVSLFDGRTLNGWTLVGQKGPGYVAENGILVCPADGGGDLLTEKDYANFIFRFEFRFEPGGNNGIGIRAPVGSRASYQGMEIQILDHDHEKYRGKIKPAQFHGSIYDVVPAKTGALNKAGEWNQQEISANGRRITVTLNGTVIVDANLDDVKDPEVLKRHPGLARTTGRIGLLGHGTRVEFRNLRVRELR